MVIITLTKGIFIINRHWITFIFPIHICVILLLSPIRRSDIVYDCSFLKPSKPCRCEAIVECWGLFINNVKQMRRGEKDGVQGGWRGECRTGQSYKKISKCERLERRREATALKAAAGFRKSEGSRCSPGRCWLDANELRRSIGGADNLLSTTRPSEQLYKGFLWRSGTSPKITLGQSWCDGSWLRANTLQQRHTLMQLLSLLLLSQSQKK